MADQPYSHTNSKGVTYHLHVNERKTKAGRTTRLYFFARDIRPEKAVAELPPDRRVEETPTGMLVLRRVPLNQGRSLGRSGEGIGIGKSIGSPGEPLEPGARGMSVGAG